MQHHEAVVLLVVVGNDVAQVGPQPWCHVARVDGGRELVRVNLQVKLLQLRHVIQQVLEVERLQRPCVRITVHADGSAGVY